MGKAKTHPLWSLGVGESTTIHPDQKQSWYVASRRISEVRGVEFEFDFTADGTSMMVSCFDSFGYVRKTKSRLRHPLHSMVVGETLPVSALEEKAYRSTANRIERSSEKRFVFLNDKYGRRVKRIDDGADKKACKPIKSKYGFEQISVGCSETYLPTLNLSRVSWAIDQYSTRSGHKFKKEWCEGGLRIHRIE